MSESAIFRDGESNFSLRDKHEQRPIVVKIPVIFEQK